jgi:PGF-pre-PGF domain-containing protein
MEELEIKNKLFILPIVIFFLLLISGIVSANEITVEPGNSIQTAINNASSGDTIILKAVTYTENLNITKSDLTIRSESGNPDDTIINAKVTTKNAIIVYKASNVVIQGIGVTGGSVSSYAGIYLYQCSGCTLENNKLTDNGYGIHLLQSNTSTLSGNTANDNVAYGIYLGNSKNNVVSGNKVDNSYSGIYLGASDYNTISGNTVTNNENLGFYECSECDYNTVYNNYFNNTKVSLNGGTGNSYNTTKTEGTNIIGGSYLGGNYWGKPDGTGFSDTAVDSDGDGIADSAYEISSKYSDYLPLVYPSSSEATAPTADFSSSVSSGNAPLEVSFTDKSTGDPTSWNWDFGDGTNSQDQNPGHTYSSAGDYTVTLTVSNENGENSKSSTINVLENTDTGNTEPVLPTADFATNATQGSAPLAIQFTDLSQNTTGWNWDFGDSSSSTDQNPLHVYETPGDYTVILTASNENGTTSKNLDIKVLEKEGLPVADFEANVTSGYAPLSVLFTDHSQDATQIAWDFNEDGVVDANTSPATYEYTSPGTYDVTLTATNENGTASKTITIDVNKEHSGGSSHSSGGGGGTGGSPEPQKNVEVKELSQVFITNGKAIQFDFTKNATCVVYVGFDSKKTVGKTTTIAEQLKNKSTLVTNLTEGEVYKYFNVWVGNSGYVSQENVENPVIGFKVEKAWLEDNNIEQDSITLYRYSDKIWQQLPVSLLNEDSSYLYYTADVPAYSFFAITGTAAAQQVNAENTTQIASEERATGEAQSQNNETQKPESDQTGLEPILSGLIAIVAIAVIGMVLKSVKK